MLLEFGASTITPSCVPIKTGNSPLGVNFLRQFAGLKILVVDLIIYRVIRGGIGLVVGSL